MEEEATAADADNSGASPHTPPAPPLDFAADPDAVSAVAEAYRLAYGHQFNPAFASEISRIDPLPHQRIAVYEHMLPQDPLRFLLADDAGAGKTIMAGLLIREMLSRGRILEQLPNAWEADAADGATFVVALSEARKAPVPWGLVRKSIEAAIASRWLDRVTAGDGNQLVEPPMQYAQAGNLRVALPKAQPAPVQPALAPTVELDASRLQDLAEAVPGLLDASAGHGLRFHVRVSLAADATDSVRSNVDALLGEVEPELRSNSGS